MPSNAKEYAAWLRQQAKEIPEQVVMPRFRLFAFKVLEVAVQNSPVNFGQLRNGWHLTVGAPSGEERAAGKSAAGVLQAGKRVIDALKFGQGLYLQNNAPHAPTIEYGLYVPKDPGPSKALHVPKGRRKRVAGTVLVKGGFHVSAPNGMLADALQTATEWWNAAP
jgi:hypothetical protein